MRDKKTDIVSSDASDASDENVSAGGEHDAPVNVEEDDFGGTGEDVFGVVDPTAIVNAKRSRRAAADKGPTRSASDSDDAYSEDEGEESESDDDGDDEEYDDEASSEEASDDDYDYADDGEEYGRNRKVRRGRGRPAAGHSGGGSSLTYQPSRVIRQPELPPVLAALAESMSRQRQQIQARQPNAVTASGAPAPLTAAQLQEMARNAVSSLAAVSSDKKLPVILPRAEGAPEDVAQGSPQDSAQGSDDARLNVSQELRQSITSMLMNPELRAALIARLQANRIASMGASAAGSPAGSMAGTPSLAPRPVYSRPFINYRPPSAPATSHETVTSSRTRRATKKVDYAAYFKKDAADVAEEEPVDKDAPSAPRVAKTRSVVTRDKRRAPSASSTPAKTKTRHMYDEGSDSDNSDDSAGSDAASDASTEPGVEKVLSHRTVRGREEFFVKFHGLAYIHAEWIGREELLESRGGGARISRFMNKPLAQHHFDDRNIFNPEFAQIDRIVHGWSHPDSDRPNAMQTSYLVKWRALPLDQATWEKEATVRGLADGDDAIREYEAIPDPWKKREDALPVGRRPEPSQWTRFESSPVYKSDNTLRSYQLEGLNWLVYCWMHKQSCIIADEMGLGKTVQTVSFLDLIYNRFHVRGPFLVVAPLSTLPHWQREFAAWTDLRVLLYHGTEAARDLMFEYEFFYKDAHTDQIIPGLCKFDVVLTTYEMTLAGQHHLRNIIWRVAVFDEAHRLKNKASRAAEVLMQFQMEHKVLLTGTPIQNSLDELFALLNFLQPHRFYSLEVFLKDYGNLRRSEDVERLQALLKPLMLRRLKEDVEKSIPVKEETIIEVELTSIQKRYYRAILERNFGFLMKGTKANNMPNLINTMIELRKCCIHPYLIKGAEERIFAEAEEVSGASASDAQMQCMVQASGKLVLVDKLLRKLREGGHRVLIFSQMTRCLDILSDYLRWRGYPHERIDGAIRGEERQAAIDRYCDLTRDGFVFLLCTKAGGVGINLTAADTVVIFDSDWNPQNDLQAQARCHRIGQTKSVKIYRLITRNTYEREMFDRAGMKLGLDKAILQKMGPETTSGMDDLSESTGAPQLNKTQVEELLRRGAYGVMMDNDDAEMRFMDEDIDSILARRTTVVKHDVPGESRSAMDGSIFSKASFAATADDLDIDLDDPNFWELWAKKMNVDPRQVSSSGVAAAVDESRMRRVLRRLQSHSKLDFMALLAKFPCEAREARETREARDARGGDGANGQQAEEQEPMPWTDEERLSLVRLLLRFGLGRFEMLREHFPARSQNDLVACAKTVLKSCIEQVAEEEPKLKEDAEKLLLSKIEFARHDKKTARQASAQDGDDESTGEFMRTELPYAGATRRQTIECRSFFRDDAAESFRATVRGEARGILIVLQTVELLRAIAEAETDGMETLAGLSIPNSARGGPVDWWGRDEDLALLVGTLRHGFGELARIKQDTSLAWHRRLDALSNAPSGASPDANAPGAFPDDAQVMERLMRVTIAIEKRNRASAKLALHTALAGSGRRRAVFEDDEPLPAGNDDDDDNYVAPVEEKHGRGRGRPRRSKKPSGPAARFLATWTKPERAEFNRLVGAGGMPSLLGDDTHDWASFRAQAVTGSQLDAKTDEELDEYMGHYLASCRHAAGRASRPRKRSAKTSRADGNDSEEDNDSEDDGESDEVAPDGIVEMVPERARKSLARIELFRRMRAPAVLEHPRISAVLEGARRSGGLPRWWVLGEHDEALLRGVAEYGLARPDLIVKHIPQFRAVYEQVESGSLTFRESRRKLTAFGDAPSTADAETATGSYPVVDGVNVALIAWPNELIVLRRVELILELLEGAGEEAGTGVEKKKPARRAAARKPASKPRGGKSAAGEVSQRKPRKKRGEPVLEASVEPSDSEQLGSSASSSPRKRRAARAEPAVIVEQPAAEEFPKIHPGRKRQKTLTDFGFAKH